MSEPRIIIKSEAFLNQGEQKGDKEIEIRNVNNAF